MPTWLFILVIIAFGLFLAIYVDRLKGRPGSGQEGPPPASERSRWLYYWYLGRFPSKAEEEEDERERRRKD